MSVRRTNTGRANSRSRGVTGDPTLPFNWEEGRVITGPDGATYPMNPNQLADPNTTRLVAELLGQPRVVDTGFDNKFTSGPVSALVNPATGNAHNAGLVARMIDMHGPEIALRRLLDEGWTAEQLEGTPLAGMAPNVDIRGHQRATPTPSNLVPARDTSNLPRKGIVPSGIQPASNTRPRTQTSPGSPVDQGGGVPQSPDNPNGPAQQPPGQDNRYKGAWPQLGFQTPFSGTPFQMAQSPEDTMLPFRMEVAQAPESPLATGSLWTPGMDFPDPTPHPLQDRELDLNALLGNFAGGAGGGAGFINYLLGMFR